MLDSVANLLKRRFSKDRKYYILLNDMFGLVPNNIELYKLALIHRSASFFSDDGLALNNERLEFLGDSIIQAVVSDYLFVEFPRNNEGFLTKVRSRLVSRETLNRISIELGLGGHLIVSHGSQHIQKHLYGDALEAMIGAVYLDKGFDYANRLVIGVLEKHLDIRQIIASENDFKSRLIEWCQKCRKDMVFDTVMSGDSNVHNPKFLSTVYVDGIDAGHGEGASKKKAEQIASGRALEFLKAAGAQEE